jgi:hypothetical protein
LSVIDFHREIEPANSLQLVSEVGRKTTVTYRTFWGTEDGPRGTQDGTQNEYKCSDRWPRGAQERHEV